MQDLTLENTYRDCKNRTRQHYENFPVASWFLPRRIRQAIMLIYTFARNADDFADEGEHSKEQRLKLLDDYDQKLTTLTQQNDDPFFQALGQTIKAHNLSIQHFHDLITAFKQDVTITRYSNFNEILNYCRYSANPVGRLLLQLYKVDTQTALAASDNICTALQLINFYQDLAQDFDEHQRIYIAEDEMYHLNITASHFKNKISDTNMQKLMQQQVTRAQDMLLSGYPLSRLIPGRMGFELKLVIEAGYRVTEKLLRHHGDVFARPRLTRLDGLIILWRAFFARSNKQKANDS
ncbi:MAG: squalene synthase HpnC [Gammaproteobacteria bacterium]|nr:squalene synthase HpnC [Gammaproteobacteria bacterium]MDH5778325.1 squalene synthase HpnC [Gammaproteobacteria bacterium]